MIAGNTSAFAGNDRDEPQSFFYPPSWRKTSLSLTLKMVLKNNPVCVNNMRINFRIPF